ncbi:MAG: large conductance mechanosensitive channel protein MscL [Clostridia bacterium]|nr:large conductance mechanosensitive channel protein MscL [Clostridia bacterium]
MKKFFKEFKDFITRGNVLDMAVGIIVGGAFTAIVTSLTENFLQPLLNVIFGGDNSAWTIGGAVAAFLTAIVTFIITAFVLFCIIKGVNKINDMKKKPEEAPAAPTTKVCPYCLSEIPIGAKKCAHCASDLDK